MIPDEVRFWEKTQPSAVSDCVEWTGYRMPRGYGRFSNWLAHRWVYSHYVKEIPEGMTVDHLCANPPCVNVAHMELVTLSENTHRQMQRMREAGTLFRQQCKRGHVFTPENIFLKPKGVGRECKTCRNNNGRAWMRRHRASLRSAQ